MREFLKKSKTFRVLVFIALSLYIILDNAPAGYLADYWLIVSIWAIFFALATVFLDSLIEGNEKEATEKPIKREFFLNLFFIVLSFYFIFTAPAARYGAALIIMTATVLICMLPLSALLFFVGHIKAIKRIKTGLKDYNASFVQLFPIAILFLPNADFLSSYKIALAVILLCFSLPYVSLDARLLFRGK